MKLHVRALVAAVGGFALGYAARSEVQRVRERRKMRQIEQVFGEPFTTEQVDQMFSDDFPGDYAGDSDPFDPFEHDPFGLGDV